MATITKRGQTWRLQFYDGARRRRFVSLGKVSKAMAGSMKTRIEYLIAAAVSGTAIDPDTARWLASCGDGLRDRLVDVGLAGRSRGGALGPFVDAYVAHRKADPKIKPATIRAGAAPQKSLREFLGDDKPLRDITKGDAKRWLVKASEGRSENTLRKWTAQAKALLNAAKDDELIERNPFEGMSTQALEVRDRDYFVTPEEADKVDKACPSIDWRLIFGLARWGGLRCPSEVLALRWEHVLWGDDRFAIHSPKTGLRFCPLFPEVRELLADAFDLAEPGAQYVVSKTRDAGDNLRTEMKRIIATAGIVPWPKVFQNLRATRATEVADQWGERREAKWIGHSHKIARKHYYQVTDADYADAAKRVATRVAKRVAANVGTGPQRAEAGEAGEA